MRYPLLNTGDEFERMCRELANAHFAHLRPHFVQYKSSGHADSGIDLVDQTGSSQIVIQCKHRAKTLSKAEVWKDLRSALASSEPFSTYIVFTTDDDGDEALRDEFAPENIRKAPLDRAVAVRIYNGRVVSALLDEFPQIAGRYYRHLSAAAVPLGASGVPPVPRNGDLQGREDELGELSRWLEDPELSLMAIRGSPGAGKTRLVAEALTKRTPGLGPAAGCEFVVWLHVGDRSLEEVAQTLARRVLQYRDGATLVDLARWLSGIRRPGLLVVFDDLSLQPGVSLNAWLATVAPFDVPLFAPTDGLRVLAVLRRGEPDIVQHTLTLARLRESAATLVIQQGLREPPPREATTRLVALADGNCLALRIINAALRCSCEPPERQQEMVHLLLSPQGLMRDLPPAVRSVLHDHPTGLLETIVAVVSDLSRPARLMLEVVALADHDSLDVALLRRVMGVAENELWTSFDELRAYSLVSTREEGDQSFVKLDTPVREAVRAQIAPGRVVQVAQSALASGAILGADADEDNVLDLVGARARILTRWALAALKVVLEASGDQLMPDVTRFLLLQRVVILADDLIQNGHHALATVLVSRWREVVAIPFSTLEQSFTDELCSYSARLDLELCRHSADGDARREKLLAAAQTWHRLMASYPTHETYAHQMVRCQERLAQLAVRMGDPAAAGQHLAEAELAMEVYAPSETRPEHLHDHHTTHARLDWLAHQSSWARLRMLLVARSCPENSSEIFDDIAVSFFRQPERDYQAIRDVLDEAIASATGWQAKILLYYRRGSLLLLPAMESANDKAITSALGDFDVVIATATQALQTEQSPRTCARLGDHLMGVTEGVRHLLSIYPGVEEQLVYTAVLAAACSRRAHEANPLDELATNTLINALELLRATRPDNKGIRVARPPSAEWAPLRCPVCGIAPDENCMRICDDGHAWSLLHLSPRCVKCSGRAVDVGCSACRFRRPIWQWRSVDSSCEVTLLRG